MKFVDSTFNDLFFALLGVASAFVTLGPLLHQAKQKEYANV